MPMTGLLRAALVADQCRRRSGAVCHGCSLISPDAPQRSGDGQARGAGRGRLGSSPGSERGIRAPLLQDGSPGTADGEAISSLIVLSRGRRRSGAATLQPSARTSEARRDSAPSLSRGGSNIADAASRGDKASRPSIQLTDASPMQRHFRPREPSAQPAGKACGRDAPRARDTCRAPR